MHRIAAEVFEGTFPKRSEEGRWRLEGQIEEFQHLPQGSVFFHMHPSGFQRFPRPGPPCVDAAEVCADRRLNLEAVGDAFAIGLGQQTGQGRLEEGLENACACFLAELSGFFAFKEDLGQLADRAVHEAGKERLKLAFDLSIQIPTKTFHECSTDLGRSLRPLGESPPNGAQNTCRPPAVFVSSQRIDLTQELLHRFLDEVPEGSAKRRLIEEIFE